MAKKHHYFDRYERDGWDRDIRLGAQPKVQTKRPRGNRKQQLGAYIKESYRES